MACIGKGKEMRFENYVKKVRRRWTRIRLHPIRVFCFHQVSDEFEPDTMEKSDWIQTEEFKKCIVALKKKYTFISLPEGTAHLKQDIHRLKEYAVLTADDGWASLKNILPWLAEQNIPVALFVNPAYMRGDGYRERDTEKYLTMEELKYYVTSCKNLSIALHGWEHKDMSSFSELEFQEDVAKTKKALSSFLGYIPYYAYPWGKHNSMNDRILREHSLTPVLMDGEKNYSDSLLIHRELLLV